MLRSIMTPSPSDVSIKLDTGLFIYAADAVKHHTKERMIARFKHLGFDASQIDGIVNNYHYKKHLNLIADYSAELLNRKYTPLQIIALLANNYREKTGDLVIDLLKEKLMTLGFNTEQVNELSISYSRVNELTFIYNASVMLLKKNYTCENIYLIARCFLGESFLTTLIDLPNDHNRFSQSLFTKIAPIASSGMAFYQAIVHYQQRRHSFQPNINDRSNASLHFLANNFSVATNASTPIQDYAEATRHLELIGFKKWQVEKMLSPYNYQQMVKVIADCSVALLKKNFNCDAIFEIMQYPFWKSFITTLRIESLAGNQDVTAAVMLMLPLALNGVTFAHAVQYYNKHHTDPTFNLKAVIRILTGMTLADYTHLMYPRKNIDVRMNAILPTLGYNQQEINYLTGYQRQMGALHNVEHFHLQLDHALPAFKVFQEAPSKLYKNFIARGYDDKAITEIFFDNDFSMEKLKNFLVIHDELVTINQENNTFISALMREQPSLIEYVPLSNAIKLSRLLLALKVDARADLCKDFFIKYAMLSETQFQPLFSVLELIKVTTNPSEQTRMLLNKLLLIDPQQFAAELALFQQTLNSHDRVASVTPQTSLPTVPEEVLSIFDSPLICDNGTGDSVTLHRTTTVTTQESIIFEPLVDIPLGRSNNHHDFMAISPLRSIMAASRSTTQVSSTQISPIHVSSTHVSPFLTSTGHMMPSFSPLSSALPFVSLEPSTRVAKRLFRDL